MQPASVVSSVWRRADAEGGGTRAASGTRAARSPAQCAAARGSHESGWTAEPVVPDGPRPALVVERADCDAVLSLSTVTRRAGRRARAEDTFIAATPSLPRWNAHLGAAAGLGSVNRSSS